MGVAITKEIILFGTSMCALTKGRFGTWRLQVPVQVNKQATALGVPTISP
jgi:hypothetical protein